MQGKGNCVSRSPALQHLPGCGIMRAKTNSQIGGMSVSDARETPAVQPPKKRMSRGTRVLVIIVCVLAAVAAVGAALGIRCKMFAPSKMA